MKIFFGTNIDSYKTNCFPEITVVPRIGETIEVIDVFKQYYIGKKLPTRLNVVDVIYTEKGVYCELWYKEIDVKSAKLTNVNLFQ